MKNLVLLVLISLLMSCSKNENEEYVSTLTDENKVPNLLSLTESNFLHEYEYVTFKKDPNSGGAPLSEKWVGEVKLFLDGNITDRYKEKVQTVLDVFNSLFLDDTSIALTDTKTGSNIHLYLGDPSQIESLWLDIYNLVKDGKFSGYARYDYNNSSYNIMRGRIWVNKPQTPILFHELGHVLGLGHSSQSYCNDTFSNRSFMCSNLSGELTLFDKAIIQTLYHPKIERGKKFTELEPVIKELLIADIINVE